MKKKKVGVKKMWVIKRNPKKVGVKKVGVKKE